MLDVIVTISDTTDKGFVADALGSVRLAADRAGYPVTIITEPGVPGHIGQAMANGFARSSAPFVAWVDDDDAVLPNAFACLASHFADSPSAICARELWLMANGRIVPAGTDRRHHLTAYARDLVQTVDLVRYVAVPNAALLRAAEPGIVDELSWVYIWRQYLSKGLALRGQNPQELA